MVEAGTATSCPLELTWASTQTMASSERAATGGDAGARFNCTEPMTMFEGACANTKMLAVVPTSCARGWICAVAFAVVGVTLAVTVIGKTGGGATPVAVKAPLAGVVPPLPFWAVLGDAPLAPSPLAGAGAATPTP